MTQVRADWYSDPSPEDPGVPTERYWDGYSWSHQVRPARSGRPTTGPYPDRPYEPSTVPSTPDGQVLAGWWQRAGAAVADVVIVVPLLVLVAAPSLAAHWDSVTTWWNAGNSGGTGPLVTDTSVPAPPVLDASTGPGLLLYASVYATSVVYAVAFLRWKQATPGKLAVGLRVRRRSAPGPLAWSTILRRVGFAAALGVAAQVPVVGVVFLVIAVLDYLWPLWDPNRQALHDKVAGTNVIRKNVEPTHPDALPPPEDRAFRPVTGSTALRVDGSQQVG